MSKGKKIALGVVIALVVIVVGLAIIIPLLLDIDRFRPEVAAHLQEETGKPAQIGHLALTILPQVSIRVDDFALGNPPGFPSGTFVKARKIYAVVSPSALLNHKVVINSIVLDDPVINLLSDVHGKWNFENPPSQSTAPPEPAGAGKASFTLGVISKVSVRGGQVSAAHLLASGAPGPALMEVHGASLDLRQVDLNAFSTASLDRPASPPGAFAAMANWLGSMVYAADAQGPLVAQGTLKAEALQFGALGVTKLSSKLRLYPKQVFFDDLNLKCYGGTAMGNLSLSFAGENLGYSTDARLKGVNVAEFLNAFPQAKGMMTGTLEGSAKVAGEVVNSPDPLAGIRGTGQMSIRNGQMPSLQLNKNLRTMAKMAGVGPASGDPSSFSSISTDFKIAEGKLTNNKVTVVGNGVDVDGSGSMTLAGDGTLDYQGDASLEANTRNPLGDVVGGLAGAKIANGKLTFPFTVGGTIANPKFSLKGGPPSPAQLGPAETVNVVRGIGGLLKKKKQQ